MDTNKTKAEQFFTKPVHIFLIAVVCTLLWGSAFPSIKSGYELFQIGADAIGSKIIFAGFRFSLAGIVTLLATFVIQRRVVFLTRKNYKGILLLGFLQTFVQYYFFYLALGKMTGSKGSIINATSTFMIVILSHFFFQADRLNVRKIIGCVLGFLGIVIISVTGEEKLGFAMDQEGFMLMASFSFAIGSIISKIITQQEDPMVTTGYQMTFGGILLVIVGFLKQGAIGVITWKGSLLFAYMVLLSAVAFTLWSMLLKYNFVGNISIYNSLNPVFGSILSGIILGENVVNLKNMVALVCVAGGIYIVNRVKPQKAEMVSRVEG